jgi:hypothetical protein
MSWSLLSAKYPRAILRTEHPMLVLGVLERKGLTTEDDLQESTGIPQPLLKKALLDLHLNQLVEYGSQYVRLTEKGKMLIERFELQTTILDDVLDSLELRGQERRDYAVVLNSYRSGSFRFYQNSLCSLRVWKSWAEAVPETEEFKDRSEHIRAGMHSLLLRDLRNWIRHVPFHWEEFDTVSESTRSLLSVHDTDDLRLSSPQKNFVIIYLSNLERGAVYDPAVKDVDPPKPRVFVTVSSLLDALHSFQAASEPDIWFDDYCEIVGTLPDGRRYQNPTRYIKALQASLWPKHAEPDTALDAGQLFATKWSPKRFVLEPGPDFLELLMMCSTIEELLRATGLAETTLRDVLVTIRDKCVNLAGSEKGPSDTSHKFEELMRTRNRKRP